VEEIIVNTEGSESLVYVGYRLESTEKLLPESSVLIITDNNVFDIYGDRFPPFPVLKIRPGEESKQLRIIEKLAGELLSFGIDRSGFLVGIGGGVVCDVTGFLASVFMRGISFGFVSSTLLSQVDASTGGKNGVNLGEVKNVIGNFRQPEFVICDTAMTATLPQDEYLSGLAELIKTGIIGDSSIIDILEKDYEAVMKRDWDLLGDLVARAVKFKASVVSEDERETGLRRILNFGHTFGHAIELHKGVKHGFAVAEGMELSAYWSMNLGFIDKQEFDRITGLLRRYKLTSDHTIPPDDIKDLISHDKKKSGSEIHFVFIKGIGKPFINKIPVNEVADFYRQIIKKK